MCSQVTPGADWLEDTFTANLESFIRPIAYNHPLNLQVQSQVPVYPAETGDMAANRAVRIDIKLWGSWHNYHRIYFAWEAKRIGDKRIDARCSTLNSEYVNEGIYRFIDNQYSVDVDSAGMLGYVLAGEVPNIVSDINETMIRLQKRPLSSSDQLRESSPIADFEDVYESQHDRADNAPIELHHLFLKFSYS